MAKPGPGRRPALQVVREGNPGHRPLRSGLQLAPSPPAEPEWRAWFPDLEVPPADPLAVGLAEDGDEEAAAAVRRRHAAAAAHAELVWVRDVARREWRRIVPVLAAQRLLSVVDRATLADHCVVVARIAQAERDISRRGLWVDGERGAVKNPSVTAVNQYRTMLRWSVGALGLSPSARAELEPPEDPGGHGDDPFD